MRKQQGFTLVEIAIVLVIIGLLLGGILRGQELIQNARVRNIIDQQNGIKAAFFGFQDRFRMTPGDLTGAQATQVGSGVTASTTLPGNGQIDSLDSATAFQNITASGFISCQTCTTTGASSNANSPVNAYGGALQLVTDAVYDAPVAVTPNIRHNVKTGPLIPSKVMYEADIKVDDALPETGQFRFSTWSGGGAGVSPGAGCKATTNWMTDPNTIDPNCGGATLIN